MPLTLFECLHLYKPSLTQFPVASVMLGKNVNFVSPNNHKISRYLQFSFRNEFDEQMRERDISWLVEKGLLK